MLGYTKHKDCLGYIVLYGNANEINLTPDRINQELAVQGLKDFPIVAPTAVVAVTRAAKELERQKDSTFFRPVVNSIEKKSVAIVREYIDKDDDRIDFQQRTTGTYDKRTNTFSAQGPDADEFIELFDTYFSIVIGDDVRLMSRKIVESTNFISIRGGEYVRDAGGVYFVPPADIDTIASLKKVLMNLKIGYVKIISLINGLSEREEIFASAVLYFTKQADQISDNIHKITIRISSLEDYKQQLNKLRDKLDAYADLTGSRDSEAIELFDLKVQECITRIDAKIAEIESEKEAKKQETPSDG